MKLDSRVIVVVVAFALAACGSVQSSGNDAAGHGGSGGSSSGTGGQGRGGTGGGAGTSSGGGTGGALGGTGGASDGRGGAGATGVAGMCGGQICTVQEICCGPAECPRCMNIPSTLCPTTCGGTGGGSGGRGGAGGAAGAGGSTGSGGRGGSTGSAGRGGTGGGLGGTGGRKLCQSDGDCQGFKCCGGFCVNVGNDILNCGSCGNTCAGLSPYCASGTCGSPPCNTPTGSACNAGMTCCGSQCCTGTQICCTVTMGPSVTGCFEPVNGTCPTGCAACVCAAPTTPIATPAGDRPIADLKVGDLVYSIDRGSLAVVPIKLVHRQPVTGSHRVVEVKLAHGAMLRISPRHPTADGRHFADLAPGDLVDGVRVIGVRLVDYDQPFTYDILPDSDSGTYFAGGALIGSTLLNRSGDLGVSATPAGTSARRASLLPRAER